MDMTKRKPQTYLCVSNAKFCKYFKINSKLRSITNQSMQETDTSFKSRVKYSSVGQSPMRLFERTGKKIFDRGNNESSDGFKNLGTLHYEGRNNW